MNTLVLLLVSVIVSCIRGTQSITEEGGVFSTTEQMSTVATVELNDSSIAYNVYNPSFEINNKEGRKYIVCGRSTFCANNICNLC